MTTGQGDSLIGKRLDGRYRVVSKIARGGMATVYLARDERLDRQVALKVMHQHLADEDSFKRRFAQEARQAAKLSSHNIVHIFDQGGDLGLNYLVMEYLPSITLRTLLKQQKRLTREQVLEVGVEVARGLAAAHAAGIVHRDLKPENVLLADDGRIKLGDFGLARAVSANTATGQALLGTIAYLSPELVTRGVADERSDIYAFGIMLFEMLTGRQPFTGDDPMQIAYQHAHSDVPVPSSFSSEADAGLDRIVRWCTCRDPAGRPRDARELLDALIVLGDGSSGFHKTSVLGDETRVLATAATAVLGSAGGVVDDDFRGSSASADVRGAEAAVLPETARRVRQAGVSRRRRGRVFAVFGVLLVGGVVGFALWLRGPGSLVAVPSVLGVSTASAVEKIEVLGLVAQVFDCPSLEYAKGLVAQTVPAVGVKVKRESVVRVCNSVGPRQLAVPTLVGLDEGAARETIGQAGFTAGETVERRFSGEAAGVVLLALGDGGEALAGEYSERARVDLIVSAGSLPGLHGVDAADAKARVAAAGLLYDAQFDGEVFSDDVAKGKVVALLTSTDPVKVGDAVGLQFSKGPELFEVPDVQGKSVREAFAVLQERGFAPQTVMPSGVWDLAEVTSTNPAAGEMVARGTEVKVRASV